MQSFGDILKRAGITKAELSRRLGINPRTVTSWGDNPPHYAVAYLDLLIKYNRLAP